MLLHEKYQYTVEVSFSCRDMSQGQWQVLRAASDVRTESQTIECSQRDVSPLSPLHSTCTAVCVLLVLMHKFSLRTAAMVQVSTASRKPGTMGSPGSTGTGFEFRLGHYSERMPSPGRIVIL